MIRKQNDQEPKILMVFVSTALFMISTNATCQEKDTFLLQLCKQNFILKCVQNSMALLESVYF